MTLRPIYAMRMVESGQNHVLGAMAVCILSQCLPRWRHHSHLVPVIRVLYERPRIFRSSSI